MTKVLGPIGLDFIESRGISVETAVRHGIFTARSTREGVIPDPAGNVLVFPFVDREAEVGEKYRGPDKRFWQRQGGKRTFWNADVLDDPALQDGRIPLIITEGEIDALTAIDCGFPLTVSVPDGAPAVPDDQQPDDLPALDIGADATGKFEFIWNNRDRLQRIKRFVLAVDNDRPGQRLAAELVRRLFASRCSFVTYPAGCKDLNDVLRAGGPESVTRVLNSAKPYPVRGLYRLSEYPEHEPLQTYTTGWETLDQHLRLFLGEFMVVTGIPSHGKSTWVLNMLANAANLHGWRAAVFSPEMPAVPHLRGKLRRIKSGQMNTRPWVDSWIDEHFVFIDADPTGQSDQDFNLDWILDRATDAVLRDHIQVLLIDPWNEIEHARGRDESLTDYIGRSIRALKRFARLRNVAVIVVAHPTKEVGKDGKSRVPTLYDIEGSAHWFNKCDHGVIVYREASGSRIFVAKSRFEEAGERGDVRMDFDRDTARFTLLAQAEQRAAEAG
jgi:twinkle protein